MRYMDGLAPTLGVYKPVKVTHIEAILLVEWELAWRKETTYSGTLMIVLLVRRLKDGTAERNGIAALPEQIPWTLHPFLLTMRRPGLCDDSCYINYGAQRQSRGKLAGLRAGSAQCSSRRQASDQVRSINLRNWADTCCSRIICGFSNYPFLLMLVKLRFSFTVVVL